jgi:hypothetical protein
MIVPRLTLARVIAVLFVLWLVISAVSLVQFHAGGSVPGDGRGDRIEGLQKQ